MTPSNQESRTSDLNALQALNSLQPPEGMQERITEHIRQRQLQFPSRRLSRYARELWAGVSIAVVAATIIVCIFALQTHHAENSPQVAGVTTHAILSAPASANAAPAVSPPHKTARSSRATRTEVVEVIPHTPPPMPLTSQERLLLALANTPSLAAGVAQTQTISQHGLGPNALFELDHEELQPMRSESKLLQPLPQNFP